VNSEKRKTWSSSLLKKTVAALCLSLFTFHFSLFTAQAANYAKLVETDAKFKDPARSPLPEAERAAFNGLNYFPIDESYRVTARFIGSDLASNAAGRSFKRGEVKFELNGRALRLAVYGLPRRATKAKAAAAKSKAEALIVNFKDATSGKQTQREGRVLELAHLADDEYVMDFNLAANAPCAYNRASACPSVPSENTLALAITAGEKLYQGRITGAPPQSGQLFADLGWFNLTSGQALLNCKLGYRTYGTLNAAKSNAVLFPSWFAGTSEQVASYLGLDKMLYGMIDPNRYFIIITDGLGNGISSSPSNTALPAGQSFPRLALRDLVNAEHELLTKVFGIQKLHAVMGISMGGMEAFEWAVAYPEGMEKVVAILGTPQLTSVDKLLWTTELKAIEEARRTTGNGDNASALVARIHTMALATPLYRARTVPTKDYEKFIAAEETAYRTNFKSADWAAQLQAMIDHDISISHGHSLLQASWRVKAQMLVVVARQDHMVNPEPALEFARLVSAQIHELNNDCGHLYSQCEGAATVNSVVSNFVTP
jgi:homoserine O-acetyltransferase/O-succinyltransferase